MKLKSTNLKQNTPCFKAKITILPPAAKAMDSIRINNPEIADKFESQINNILLKTGEKQPLAKTLSARIYKYLFDINIYGKNLPEIPGTLKITKIRLLDINPKNKFDILSPDEKATHPVLRIVYEITGNNGFKKGHIYSFLDKERNYPKIKGTLLSKIKKAYFDFSDYFITEIKKINN